MLYQYVRSALGLIATGEDKLSQAQQLLLGTLVIGASDTVTGFLTPYLDAFHRLHPGIRLKIVSGRSAKVLALLRSGAVDIAFASSPADPGLSTWPCFATHTAFVAGRDYDCDFDHIYTRREIADFPLILLERKASSRVFLEQEFLKYGVTLTPEIELSSRRLLVTLARIGLGVAGVTLEFRFLPVCSCAGMGNPVDKESRSHPAGFQSAAPPQADAGKGHTMKDLKPTCSIAVVQAAPVLFDKAACTDKAVDLIAQAAGNGAELIVFPELFIPGYPYGMTFGFTVGSRTPEAGRTGDCTTTTPSWFPASETQRLGPGRTGSGPG